MVSAPSRLEVVLVAQAQLTPEQLVLDDLSGVEALELVERALASSISSWARSRTAVISFSTAFWRALTSRRGPFGLELGQLLLERLETAVDFQVPAPLDVDDLVDHLGLEGREVLVALRLVDPGDQVGGEVDDLLQLLGLQLLTGLGAHEQVGQPAARAAQVPDVHDRGGQLDVAMRSRRTFERVTSTPQRSQMMPLKRTRLYLPQ